MATRMIVEDQKQVVEFLSNPENLGADSPVRRIDTHGAIVFLAGECAFKLKRAVRFDYMDYSTVTRRRLACEAELRINRRTAPAIYRKALPIVRRGDGSLGWGGRGKIVDWVVVMARFDENKVFDELAQRGELSGTLIDGLADAIARFHEHAETTSGFGGTAGIAEVVEENANELARYPGLFDAMRVARWKAATGAMLAELGPRLERRREAGLVRRCHGDLHLRNVCLVDDRPTLFDAVEFSEAFACIDVFYDLAFLLMDLWHRGLKTEANRVLNRYLWWRDDLDGLGPLPLFLSCRAAIRAHVAAAAIGSGPGCADARARREEATSYFELAHRFLERKSPRLIAIGGLSGSGKSTVARRLAPAIGRAPGALVLQSDVVRKRMFGADPEDSLPATAYTAEAGDRVYARLRVRARAALADGAGVIVDAVHAGLEDRLALERLAANAGVPFTGLWLEAPEATLVERVTRRGRDVSDAGAAVVEMQTRYESGDISWPRVWAMSDPQTLTDRIRTLVDTSGASGATGRIRKLIDANGASGTILDTGAADRIRTLVDASRVSGATSDTSAAAGLSLPASRRHRSDLEVP